MPEMVMQLGDYGTDVKNMQARLAKLNYLSSANATGYFGEITEDAVESLSKARGPDRGRQGRRRNADDDKLLQREEGSQRPFDKEGEQEQRLLRQQRLLWRVFRRVLERRIR